MGAGGGSKKACHTNVTSWILCSNAHIESCFSVTVYRLRRMKFPSGSESSIGVTCFQRTGDVMEAAADVNSSRRRSGEPPQ